MGYIYGWGGHRHRTYGHSSYDKNIKVEVMKEKKEVLGIGAIVECLEHNNGYRETLTVGKKYEVIYESERSVGVIGDKGSEIRANRLRFKKVSKMTDKELALKALKEAERQVVKARQMVEDLDKIKGYKVRQKISYYGNILFNDMRSILIVSKSGITVITRESPYKDYASYYIWIPIEKEDIKSGDVIYTVDLSENETGFDSEVLVRAIVNGHQNYRIDKNSIQSHPNLLHNNYKLTPRSDLE